MLLSTLSTPAKHEHLHVFTILPWTYSLKCYARVSPKNEFTTTWQNWRLNWKGSCTNGYIDLHHVYHLGQELMRAERGVILLLEMLLHLKSKNRWTQLVTVNLHILPQLASVKAIVALLVICCRVVETIDTCKYSRGITYTTMCLLSLSPTYFRVIAVHNTSELNALKSF